MSAFEVFCTKEFDETPVLMLWHGDGYGWQQSKKVVRLRVGGFGGFTQTNAERTAEMWRSLHAAWVQRQTLRHLTEARLAGYDYEATW